MIIGIVDIETTGFKMTDCILEIGMSSLCLETGQILTLYDSLVREKHFGERYKDSWIFKNSNLKYEDILSADRLDFETIQSILKDYKFTAYNKKFDFGFLKNRGFQIEELDCPMLISKDVCKIKSSRGGYKWPSVEESYKFLFNDPSYVEAHRGCMDSRDEAKIVYELYKRGAFKV